MKEIGEEKIKFKRFENWLIKNYTNFLDNKEYMLKVNHFYCTYSGVGTHLRLLTNIFPKWNDLLKKYRHEQLIDYFMGVVRIKLPQLKGTKLIFTSNKEKEINVII